MASHGGQNPKHAAPSTLEIDFWQYLVADGGLHLKQRIPDIALFHKCTLRTWLYSSAKGGLLKRRTAADAGPGGLTPSGFLQKVMDQQGRRYGEKGQPVG